MDLRELLKTGRIVVIDCFKGDIRTGIVDLNGKSISTPQGFHVIDGYTSSLAKKNEKILRIYETTEQGLELIWNRDEFVIWEDVEVDAKILVKMYEEDNWIKRHFAKYENGVIFAWESGKTSFTAENMTVWKYAKLGEE